MHVPTTRGLHCATVLPGMPQCPAVSTGGLPTLQVPPLAPHTHTAQPVAGHECSLAVPTAAPTTAPTTRLVLAPLAELPSPPVKPPSPTSAAPAVTGGWAGGSGLPAERPANESSRKAAGTHAMLVSAGPKSAASLQLGGWD